MSQANAGPPLLEMRGIVKTFPGVRALDGVDLEVVAGEVHCLLGQNGAGKSTLIKILAGVHVPDAGEVIWRGEPASIPTPPAAIALGIATMYQELDLVDGLTVAENIFLGHEHAGLGFVRRREMQRAAADLLARLGHPEISPGRELGSLSAAGKQIVSMARALSHDARLLVMDEPSAVLAHDEVTNLFRVIRGLIEQGVAVLYISHRLDEIRQIGDRLTVLKDGRTVGSNLPAQTTKTSDVVRMMTGRNIAYDFPPRPPAGSADDAEVLLEVEHLTRTGEFTDVSFTVRAGEIVGLAGLVGAGRSELLETIYGARKSTSGRVRFLGREMHGDVARSVAMGMGLAPEERKSQGLLMLMSVAQNVTAASLRNYHRLGFLRRDREVRDARKEVEGLEIRPSDVSRIVSTMSGGNQQKVVLARWLLKNCKLLLFDEPTRGVDVGARAELYHLIRSLADRGVGVVLVSSEVPEVLGLADRVLVIRDGVVVEEAIAEDLDEERVLDLVMQGSAVMDSAAVANTAAVLESAAKGESV
jgi:ribose transport system ATP-binding protein